MFLFPANDILLAVLSFVALEQWQFTETATLSILSMQSGNGEGRVCPAEEKRDAAIKNITAQVINNIRNAALVHNCGGGEWYQVAKLNMSNSSQQCPSAWIEYNSNGIRSCRRPHSSSGSCSGTSYTTGRQYSKVCGRTIGYQIGATDGYGNAVTDSIDSYYVYGVSFTHGTPRNHIWTLASGVTEGGYWTPIYDCPCADPSNPNNTVVPSFVGDNYYCESGNPTNTYELYHLYSSDPLWDGEQCEGECCSNGKSPPWFSVQLPNPTTDDIEVRVCIPQGSFDDVAIEELEIYIQ